MTFETYFELGQHKSQAHHNPKKKQILYSCSSVIAIPKIKLETPSTTNPNLRSEPLVEQGFGQDSMECVSNAIGNIADKVFLHQRDGGVKNIFIYIIEILRIL
jgi:hypothetical protein